MNCIKLTESGKCWLEQFNSHERPYAELLLDNLTLISANKFNTGLIKLIERLSKKTKKPIGLVPVREMANGQSYYKQLRERNCSVNLVNPKSLIGSEGVCANITKNLKTGYPEVFTATPNLKNLREARCREVFFVEDFIGSGKRCSDFIEGFYRHPTIKSWRSRKLIKLRFAVFAATETGQQLVESHRLRPSVDYAMRCPTLATVPLTERQKEYITELCRAHGPDEEYSLGFRGSCGLMVFHHKAPNNLPGMLWQSGKKWKPLFPGGSVPTDLHECFDEDQLPGVRERIWELGQPKLALSDWLDKKNNNAIKMVIVLAAITAQCKSIKSIANSTFFTTMDVEDLVELGQKWGLITSEFRLTDDGKRHLERLKGDFTPEPNAEPKMIAPYFPRSLR